jgi:hypothetical protein
VHRIVRAAISEAADGRVGDEQINWPMRPPPPGSTDEPSCPARLLALAVLIGTGLIAPGSSEAGQPDAGHVHDAGINIRRPGRPRCRNRDARSQHQSRLVAR